MRGFQNNYRIMLFTDTQALPYLQFTSLPITQMHHCPPHLTIHGFLPKRIDQWDICLSFQIQLGTENPLQYIIKQIPGRKMECKIGEATQNHITDSPLKDDSSVKLEFIENDIQSCSSGSAGKEQLHEGRWSEEDNLRFVVFIHKNQQIFSSKHQRKSCKIFKLLSQHLINRTPAQCRSHFQKFMIKYKTIAKLKRFYRKKFGEQLYHSEMERLMEYTHTTDKKIEEIQGGKKSQEFGVQTETYQNRQGFVQYWPTYQTPAFVNYVDYGEFGKVFGVKPEEWMQNNPWHCFCFNNPQFV